MAEKTIVIRTDDLDGSEGARQVQFAFDGKSYQIDLAEANVEKLAEALAPFIAGARRAGGPARRGRAGGSESARIRAWARSAGIDVPERGRIPGDVVEKYKAAN